MRIIQISFLIAIFNTFIFSKDFSTNKVMNKHTIVEVSSYNNKLLFPIYTAYEPILNLDDIPQRYQTIVKGLPLLQTLGTTVMSIIYMLPSETSNWDKKTFKKSPLWKNWYYNVTHGPVIDPDSWLINYVEHPYVGSSYYIWGRESGLSKKESFGLSLFLSMIYWEYGWEALIEPPSWQDLLVTPIVGSLLGEKAYKIKQKIDRNGGMIYHSKFIGTLVKILLNPIGEINTKLAYVLKNHHIHTKTNLEVFYKQRKIPSPLLQSNSLVSKQLGLRVHIRF